MHPCPDYVDGSSMEPLPPTSPATSSPTPTDTRMSSFSTTSPEGREVYLMPLAESEVQKNERLLSATIAEVKSSDTNTYSRSGLLLICSRARPEEAALLVYNFEEASVVGGPTASKCIPLAHNVSVTYDAAGLYIYWSTRTSREPEKEWLEIYLYSSSVDASPFKNALLRAQSIADSARVSYTGPRYSFRFDWLWRYGEPVCLSSGGDMLNDGDVRIDFNELGGITSRASEEMLARTATSRKPGRELKVWVLTWNVAAQKVPKKIPAALNPPDGTDIVFISLQETIELKPVNVLWKDNHNTYRWLSIWDSALPNYTLVGYVELVGILLACFVSKDVHRYIEYVDEDICKTGTFGYTGNKGAAGMRVDVGDTSLVAIAVHLSAGEGGAEMRRRQYYRILDNIRLNSMHCFESTVMFAFGDWNARSEVAFDETTDELVCGSRVPQSCTLWEPPLSFKPTYKTITGTEGQQYSAKRVPSWCDRILCRASFPQALIPEEYRSVPEVDTSDHSPVVGVYKLRVTGVV
ncbi:Endonuclease Exonuclease phosphatase protein [Perkinsus olseni]|uniref:Endonuclease Exonuclease phosphatase protein n=1 Tax=Perkinsus olseni TaxID=32597 RepID=A0A7J6U6E6_PEROL|nr:Endonuclease Exonuclease phosphatase protein [Perkinsus olseni]